MDNCNFQGLSRTSKTFRDYQGQLGLLGTFKGLSVTLYDWLLSNSISVDTLLLLLLLLERITDTTPSNLLANIDIIEHKLCLSDNFLKAYQMVHSMPMMGLTLLQYSLILERRFPYYFFIKNFHLEHGSILKLYT